MAKVTSNKKSKISMSVQLDILDVNTTVSGVYGNDVTSLGCIANLTREGGKLKTHFAKVLPADQMWVLDKIDLRQVIVEVKFSARNGMLYYSIGADVTVDGKLLQFRLFKREEEILVSMSLANHISFAGLPLVGEYLGKEDGISGLQVIYYKNAAGKKQLPLQQAIPAPAFLAKYPHKKMEIQEGINIFALIGIGDKRMPLSYPDQAIVSMDGEQLKTAGANSLPDAKVDSGPPVAPARKFMDVRGFELLYDRGNIGFRVSGSVSISLFQLEVMGLQVTAPINLFRNFSMQKIAFDLQGLSIDIRKPPVTISGAFLRVPARVPGGDDDYFGLFSIAFQRFQLTAVGAYSKKQDYSSVFMFAFVGIPLGGPPCFFVTGLALGFGLNRDFILPDISRVADFSLVSMCRNNDPKTIASQNSKAGVIETLQLLGDSIPPRAGSYFMVAGIRFESYTVLKTVAVAAIKLAPEVEVNLLGVSSLTLPSVYAELAFSVQFAPAKGVFMARGMLTSRSYLLFPGIRLTGGFAVGFWFAGDHAGDFVVSFGGYHPRYQLPGHFPGNIPRIALNGRLDNAVTFTGEVYFALTSQAIMAGIYARLVYQSSMLYASITLRADFIVLWKPFYYDAKVSAGVYVKFSIGPDWCCISYDFEMHVVMDIWGPDFSGKVLLETSVKNFSISFGANVARVAPRISWDEFRKSFIPPVPCSIYIAGGLMSKVMHAAPGKKEVEYWVVNPKELLLVTDSLVPATKASFGGVNIPVTAIDQPGIPPMGESGFTASHAVSIYKLENGTEKLAGYYPGGDFGSFRYKGIYKKLPKAIWGSERVRTDIPPDPGKSLVYSFTGFEIAAAGVQDGKGNALPPGIPYKQVTHTFKKDKYCIMKGIQRSDHVQRCRDYINGWYQREKSLRVLSDLLPPTECDLSDLIADIAAYTYTEPFLSLEISYGT